jgi:hypothetical protein
VDAFSESRQEKKACRKEKKAYSMLKRQETINMLKRQACERPKFFKSQNQPCRNQKDVTASEVSQRFL